MKKQASSPKPKAELSISERPIREAKNPSAKWPGGRKSNAESKHIYLKIILNLNTSGDEFDRPIETIASWSIRPEGTRGSKSIYW